MTRQDMERVKRAVIRKYPIFASVALLNVPIEEDKNISTAAVWALKNDNGELDLKGIKYNPEFFDNLSFEQQVFVLAHETCHIAFEHFARSLDKPAKDIERKYEEYCTRVTDENLRKIERIRLHKKYNNIWNIATDACINAFLVKDELDMPDGVIDKKTGQPMRFVKIKDGLYRRSELIYDALVKKEEEKEQNKEQNKEQDREQNKENNNMESNQDNSSVVGGGLDDIDVDDYRGIDSHDEWVSEPSKSKSENNQVEESEENKDKENNKKDKEKDEEKNKKSKSFWDRIKDFLTGEKDKEEKDESEKQNDLDDEESEKEMPEISTDEASVFEENERERDKRDNKSLNQALNNITKEVGASHVKPVKPVLSWKYLLIRSVEEETERWGYRRANRHMPNARMEDRTLDDRATTEVILDTSGSISDSLLRGFLRQLVPLFKETEIKVGCFGGSFHGFVELKSIKQIEEFKAVRDSNGTNFEAAALAFSKDNGYNKINKIVFTDGELDGIASHIQKTKVDGIMWIVFGDKMDFKPVSGKIIKINKNDLNQMISITPVNNNYINYQETDMTDDVSIKRRR